MTSLLPVSATIQCLLSHDGLYPFRTISQNKPFLPEVTFGHCILSQQQKSNATRALFTEPSPRSEAFYKT